MLAAHHDQENVYTHQATASKQQLQAKTPGVRYPKTPLKVPLNDENKNHGLQGKVGLQGKGHNENTLTVGKGADTLGKSGKIGMVTPAAPRTGRAPLGNKTTNAKARATHQTPGTKAVARDLEKTTSKPVAIVKPNPSAPQAESSKLAVHTDKDPLKEEDIEYAPPKPKDLPYESDVFPDGVLTFEGLKPENLFKGYYQYYFNRVDDEGKTAVERDMEERQKRSFERGEEQIRRDMDEFIWNVGDISEGKNLLKQNVGVPSGATATLSNRVTRLAPKQPSTLASRKAAAALAMPATSSAVSQARSTRTAAPSAAKAPTKGFLLPKRKPLQPVSQPTTIPVRERAPAVAASRSTLGYNKGRSISSAVNGTSSAATARQLQGQAAGKPRTLVRSASTASSSSDTTITPARFAQSSETKKPDFLSIFDGEDEEDTLGGGMPPMDDDNDDFHLTVKFE